MFLAGGCHNLRQPNTDSLPLVSLTRVESTLQDGDYFRQNSLTQFSHQVTKRTSCNLETN